MEVGSSKLEPQKMHKLSRLYSVVRFMAVADVLLATVQITLHVYLMSEKLPELELVPGSRPAQFIAYGFTAFTCLVQLLSAFKFYLTLARNEPQEDIEEELTFSTYWMIASYLLLVNWLVRTGIYSQQKRTISPALVMCIIEVSFRIANISVLKVFISRLSKIKEQRRAQALEEATRKLKMFQLQRKKEHQNHKELSN